MRYALISDLHSNGPALDAIQQALERERFDDDMSVLFLGDLCGYGPAACTPKCIQWLRRQAGESGLWLAGNHDEWLLNRRESVSTPAALSLICQRVLLQRPEHSDLWDWLKTGVEDQLARGAQGATLVLPPPGEAPNGLGLVCTHGSLLDRDWRSDYLMPWNPAKITADLGALDDLLGEEAAGCLACGHSHFPFFAEREGTHLKFRSIRYGEPLPISGAARGHQPGQRRQPA